MPPRELINANVTHVSYVGKAANKKQFFLTKSAAEPVFKKEVKLFINKSDEEQKLVYGVVYEPGNADDTSTHDTHGDFMSAESIEKAAHGFMKEARNIDKEHDFEAGVGEVVESYIAPTDFTLGEQEVKKGAWVLVTKASDEVWEAIKKGEYTGYSLAGTAETIEKQEEKPAGLPNEQETGLFNLLKNFFTGSSDVQKGEVKDRFQTNQKRRDIWSAWDTMEDVFYDSVWENTTAEVIDFERLQAATADFLDLVNQIRTKDDIQKALESKPEEIKKSKGETELKAEDIAKAVEAALEPINERLTSLEKEEEEPTKEDDVVKSIQKAVEDAVKPLNDRVEAIEKSRGQSKQIQSDAGQGGQLIAKSGYMDHFNQ